MRYSFVAYQGPSLPEDPNVRTLIRRRAMADAAAARKQKGNYGQHNLRQIPVYPTAGEAVEVEPVCEVSANSDSSDSPSRHRLLVPGRRGRTTEGKGRKRGPVSEGRICPVPFLYPGLDVSGDFLDLINLIPLTGLRLGIAPACYSTAQWAVQSRSISAFPVGRSRPGSHPLLSFIPSRYGRVSSITHAADCVLAKLKQTLQCAPPGGDAVALKLYSKALRSLQEALNDASECMSPETLCATELLGVFEVLEGKSDAHSWIQHASGAARLMEARGADKFNSDFELALLSAQIGPTVMDAFLNNKASFLGEEEWQHTMRNAICSDESLSGHADFVLLLWMHLANGPRRFKDTTDLILSPIPPPQYVIDELIEDLSDDRQSLIRWLEYSKQWTCLQGEKLPGWKETPGSPLPTLDHNYIGPAHVTQLALRGTYLSCIILKSRLLFGLAPARFAYLEAECQELSRQIMALNNTSGADEVDCLVASLFTSQSAWLAKGVLETQQFWAEGGQNQKGMIENWKFEAWCKAIRRRLHFV